MHSSLDLVLSKYVSKQQHLESIQAKLNEEKSMIIEVTGNSGSGKSYLLNEVKEFATRQDLPYLSYMPAAMSFNQVKELILAISSITDIQFQSLTKEAQKLGLESQYDFFYFLTEYLEKNDLLISQIIFIDNCNYLDTYTLDFIQYLSLSDLKINLKFVVITSETTFLFSEKIKINMISMDELRQIIQDLFPNEVDQLKSKTEILKEISAGDIYVIRKILEVQMEASNDGTINLTKYLDRKLVSTQIFSSIVSSQPDEIKEILHYTFLLGHYANISNLNILVKNSNFRENLDKLLVSKIAYQVDEILAITNLGKFKSYFEQLPNEVQNQYYKKIVDNFSKLNISQTMLYFFQFKMGILNLKNSKHLIDFMSSLNDHRALQNIYKSLLKKENKPEHQSDLYYQLALTYSKLNEAENSSENLRTALKIATENHLPVDRIVIELAGCLLDIGSISFTLEILKKFENNCSNTYWQVKSLLKKAEALTIQENYDEGLQVLQSAHEIILKFKDKERQNEVLAECKKIMGKLYYFSYQWDKSEQSYLDAEKIFKKTENFGGLAAIYNNLGVLAMFHGDWDKTEIFYQKSLELEQKRFSLKDVAVCYNNLGSVMQDMGNFKKAMYYLHEGLRIQKLLGDRLNITYSYNNIGVAYMDNGEYKEAEKAFQASLHAAMTYNLFRIIIASLNNLGALHFKAGRWMKAIEFYERAIEKARESDFMEGLCTSYNNLGELYEMRGEYGLAYDLYFKGVELLPMVNDDYQKAELYINTGSVLTMLHNFGEAYSYLVQGYEYFKNLDAKDKLVEASQKQAMYFIKTRNYESAAYYLETGKKLAEEMNNRKEIGIFYYLESMLQTKDTNRNRKLLEQAIEIFVETKDNFQLAQANYSYAKLLYKLKNWEQALEILNNNKQIIQKFDAIKFLEQNDILIQKIEKEHAIELKETKIQETLLNHFYEITQNLNSITDFDMLLETSLQKLVELSEADGGMLSLYNSRGMADSWEYKVFNNFSEEDHHYDDMIEIVYDTFSEMANQNIKQPQFAPQYNNIISFPLIIRNNNIGVILLFSRHGSHYFTDKMFNLLSALCNQIVVIIENIRHSNLTKAHAIIREELNESNNYTNIIGKSSKMMEIFQLIEKVRDTPTTILLEGPSGTGKELIARAIHYTSKFRNKKFIAQYCGALPETLLESELFGHVKGSFTGAAYDKKGLFELADGGTFFLDEIADISLSTQAKLLRFLQEGEIKRVGSTKTQKVNVRVICATNVSLQDNVKKGEFRLDLYYRLNVIKIRVPALNERKSDIPLLAIHFLDRYNKKISKNVVGITDEAMRYLINCEWPGNIRQLENEVERAVTLVENESFIKPSDLSDEVFKYAEYSQAVDVLDKVTLKEAVMNLERKMISRSLRVTDWNQTQAAKELGLSRQGLIKKIKRYKLEK
jgi:transcriptional regulator with GAF, ATPase, and Fis domain/Tfp pilus assembly protein PilF